MDCKHTAWLDLVMGSQTLFKFNRLQALLERGAFKDPSVQTPSLVILLGSTESKTRTLGKLIRSQNASNNYYRADVHIYNYSPTKGCSEPLLLADCAMPNRSRRPEKLSSIDCHETIRRQLPHVRATTGTINPTTLKPLREYILARLLGPFTDVICIFWSDFGGSLGVAEHLKEWATKDAGQIFPRKSAQR